MNEGFIIRVSHIVEGPCLMTIVSPRVGALNGGRQWQRRRRRSRAEGGLVIFRAAVSIVWCMFYCVWGHVSAHVPDTLGHLNPFISATTEKIFNATTRSPAPRGGMGFARPKTRISNMPNCRRSVIAQESTVDEYQKFKYIIDDTHALPINSLKTTLRTRRF